MRYNVVLNPRFPPTRLSHLSSVHLYGNVLDLQVKVQFGHGQFHLRGWINDHFGKGKDGPEDCRGTKNKQR